MPIPSIPTDITCPVCQEKIVASVTTSKRGRHAIGLKCPRDGCDFRGFVNNAAFVESLLERITAASTEVDRSTFNPPRP